MVKGNIGRHAAERMARKNARDDMAARFAYVGGDINAVRDLLADGLATDVWIGSDEHVFLSEKLSTLCDNWIYGGAE